MISSVHEDRSFFGRMMTNVRCAMRMTLKTIFISTMISPTPGHYKWGIVVKKQPRSGKLARSGGKHSCGFGGAVIFNIFAL